MLTYQHSITGKVQGVGYRRFAQKHAITLGLCGWARNRADGSVEVLVQGAADPLSLFAEKLRKGPPFGSVEAVKTTTIEKNKFENFEIYPDEESPGGSQ